MPTPHSPLAASELAGAERVAQLAADAASTAILPHFRQHLTVESKLAGGYDPVTAADREAEAAIRAVISRHRPDHGITGEELDNEASDSPFEWVIDPIDGTRAFVLGLPTWGTLIALKHQGRPVLGVMAQPFTRERFWSAGGSSWFRGPDDAVHRISTRPCPDLGSAMLSTTHPDLFANGTDQNAFARILNATRACRYGGDCYAYCMLAMGLVDIIVEAGLKPFDIAALVPIIENAGGRVTTWDGGPADKGGRIVATGDPALHAQALDLLAR